MENKRLYRSVSDRMIAGVCAGLGDYLGIDPTLVRLIFAFAVLFGGGGLVIYIVMALVIPEEPYAPGSEVMDVPTTKETEAPADSDEA